MVVVRFAFIPVILIVAAITSLLGVCTFGLWMTAAEMHESPSAQFTRDVDVAKFRATHLWVALVLVQGALIWTYIKARARRQPHLRASLVAIGLFGTLTVGGTLAAFYFVQFWPILWIYRQMTQLLLKLAS